jgi:small subunit ribosomal protein S13
MARIAGIDLPRNKRGVIGLTYIYGVGRSRAQEILLKAEVSEHTKVQDWTDENIREISRIVNNDFKVEGELRSEVQLSIKRLMDIACYRGLRHRKGFRFVDKEREPMHVPVRAAAKRLPTKKSNQVICLLLNVKLFKLFPY